MKTPPVVYVALTAKGCPVGVTKLASEAKEWRDEARQGKLRLCGDDETHHVAKYVIDETDVAKPKKSKRSKT